MTLNVLARVAVALCLALPAGAHAETDAVPLPDRNPVRNSAKGGAAAVHPVLPGDAPTVPWTDSQIAAAEADCTKLLAGLALEYEKLAPIKKGICGAPAPILVKSIGSDPKVAIEPPATMTCKLAAGLSVWLAKTVQPKARAVVGAPVVKLRNATSYACRNRYGGETTPLSEHALANALDVSEFVFQTGRTVTVLASWPHGPTAPSSPVPKPVEVATEAPHAHGHADVAQPGDYTSSITAVSTTSLGMSLIKPISAMVKANPFVVPISVPIDPHINPFAVPTAVAKAAPAVPPAAAKPETPALPESQPGSDANGKFVKAVHDEACTVFGTVLGPEANAAHKNHFHLDMKARRHSVICE
jgi:hypothetical protein